MNQVPLRILRQAMGRMGKRLTPMRILAEPKQPKPDYFSGMVNPTGYDTSRNTRIVNYKERSKAHKVPPSEGPQSPATVFCLTDTLLDFNHWEFRFYMVDPDTKPLAAMCRVCQKEFSTVEARKMHNKTERCFHTLQHASKIMLGARCVICNNRTLNKKWGFFMCGEACNQQFMHAIEQPEPLYQALEDYKKLQELEKKRPIKPQSDADETDFIGI